MRRGLAHGRYAQNFRCRHFDSSILFAFSHHSRVLHIDFLQTTEQQEATVEEQELEEEEQLREGAEEENVDKSNARADGEYFRTVLAATEHDQHPRRLHNEHERVSLLQFVLLYRTSCGDVVCYLQSHFIWTTQRVSNNLLI